MYTVYKITNNINQKTYIGVHKTNNPNDCYFGSGIAIKNAIKKYGKENFKKEVLFITEDKIDAYRKERELTLDYIYANTYNMRLGGVGGFTSESAKNGFNVVMDKYGNTWFQMGNAALREKGTGIYAFSTEQRRENGRKGGLAIHGKPKSEEHKKNIRKSIVRKKIKCMKII